jgi:predicted DNA-binding transcriptional regulator YafY
MAKKRKTAAKTATKPSSAITQERFVRLYRLIELLASGPQTRANLMRTLRLDVRGFYRDLDVLRSAGVSIWLSHGRYSMHHKVDDALNMLPFPDPRLTLGEMRTLAKGRTAAHRALVEIILRILPA